MINKNPIRPIILFLLTVFVLSLIWVLGCGEPTVTTQKELTPEELQAQYDSLMTVHKKQLALYWSLGYEPYKQKDYKRALKYFRKVAKLDTTNVYGKILYSRLGDCYLNLNKPDSANVAYKLGIERNPSNPYFYKILIYIYKNDPAKRDEAITLNEQLIGLEPDSSAHYLQLGRLHLQNDDEDAATEILLQGQNKDPSNDAINNLLSGLIKDPRERIEVLLTALNNNPDDITKRFELAKSYSMIGEYGKAITELKIVIEAEPQNKLALEYLGQAYNESNQFTNAVNTYQKILDMNPQDVKNISAQAMAYAELGNYTTALAKANKALNIDRDYGLAYIARGFTYETAANKCSAQNSEGMDTFDDKLVYKMAYDEYQKAKAKGWGSEANSRIAYLEGLIPTRSDLFMNKGQTMPRTECYSWVQ